MAQIIRKNESDGKLRRIYFLVYSDTDGVTPWSASIPGGTKARLSWRGYQSNGSTLGEQDSGADIARLAGAIHYIELSQGESNYFTGPLTVRLPATSGRLEGVGIAEVMGFDPFAAGPTAADVRTEIDSNSTSFAALLGADVAYKKNTGVSNFLFYMALTTGEPATSKTVTVQIAKDSGSFATVGGAVSEVGGAGNGAGWYRIATLSATEMNADEIAFKATATDCAQGNWKIRTQS